MRPWPGCCKNKIPATVTFLQLRTFTLMKQASWGSPSAEKRLKGLNQGSDEHLLVEAAQRDPLRFADLYELHFHRVYAYVVKKVKNREEAEDVTSEVFQQALAKIKDFEWRGTPFL